MTKTTHFRERVSQITRDKLTAIAQAVKDDFIGEIGEGYGCVNISDIPGVGYDGFIPSQLGGYEVSELVRSDIDTSYHISRAQTEAMQEREKSLYESFKSDNKLDHLPKDYCYRDLTPDQQNDFADYENDWFEPALLRFEIWVDDPNRRLSFDQEEKKPESVFYRLSLNYRDASYYRSKHDDTLFEGDISIKSLPSPKEFIARLNRQYVNFCALEKAEKESA